MSCGIGSRLGLDTTLLWLWRRLAAAALMGPQPENFHMLPRKKKKRILTKMYLNRRKKIDEKLLIGKFHIFIDVFNIKQ